MKTKIQPLILHDNAPNNIIISGAGLAGLCTSLGLAKLGYHIDIIECRKEWLQQGSAFGLAANGRKALLQLFHNPSSLDTLIAKGIYIASHDSYLLVWYMIRDALLVEVEQCSLITVHMGKTVESYDDSSDASCIHVVMKDVENDTDRRILKGSLLIAADGVYSNIRQLAGLDPAKFATKTKWRGTIPHVPDGSVLEQFLDKGTTPLMNDESTAGLRKGKCIVNLFNFHPTLERKMTFVLNVSVTDLPPGTHPREIFAQHLTDPFHLQILEEIYHLSDDRELTYPLAMAVIELPKDGSNGWGGNGRVLLVGDSAHAMRPASGLGGALAFEDAVVLSRLLKSSGNECLNTKKSAHAFVREFESSRFDRVSTIWQNQWEISEGVYNKEKPDVQWTKSFTEWVNQGV